MGLFDDYFQTSANQGYPQVPVYDRTGQSAVSMTQRPVGYIMNPDIASPTSIPTRTQTSPSQTQPSMPNLRVAGLPVSAPVQALAKYNQQMQQQRQAQTPQSSMLAKIRSGLGASPTSPTGMALDSAAQSLLQQSGYSPVPRTTGQIFGEALGAAREGYMGGKALEQQAEQRAYEREKAEREFEYKKQQDQLNLFMKELEINKSLQDSMRARKAAEFGNEKDLRKEFDTQSKDFTEARIGLEKVLTAGLDPNPTGASDVALVFGYMKVLDPNSVVREGEFATAENTAGVSGKLRTIYNRLLTGTRLTQPQRENFVSVSKSLFDGQLEMQKEREQNFINLSNSYELTPSQVVVSRLPKVGSIINPREIQDKSEADDLPKGSYIILNGRLGIVE